MPTTAVDWIPQIRTTPDTVLVHTLVTDALLKASQARPQALVITQVYPLVVQNPAVRPPFIVYNVGEVTPLRGLNGYAGQNSLVTFVVVHTSYIEAKRACGQIVQVLWDYANGQRFRVGSYNFGEDEWDPDSELYTCNVNVSLWHA